MSMYIVKKKKEKVKNTDEKKIVADMQRGKKSAYRQIVEIYQKKLFAYVYRLIGNKEESEDIIQNVFVKAHRSIDNFDLEKRFSPWIYRIAHNEAVNFLKKQNKKKTISWEEVVSSDDKLKTQGEEFSPLEDWMQKETVMTIRQAMKKMPEKYREVLVERYFLDKSYEEISAKLGSPVNTVGTMINRAKKRLLRIVEGEKK